MRDSCATILTVLSMAFLASACGSSSHHSANDESAGDGAPQGAGGAKDSANGGTDSVADAGRGLVGDAAGNGGTSHATGAAGVAVEGTAGRDDSHSGGTTSEAAGGANGGVSNSGGTASGATGGVTRGGVPSTGGMASAATGGLGGGGALSSGGAEGAPTGGMTNGGASPVGGTAGTSTGGATCGPRGTQQGELGGYGDELPPVPHECLVDAECADGICFDGPDAQALSCRRLCDVASVGQTGTCDPEQICVYASGAARAACMDPCEPFQAIDTCPQGNWCQPAPSPSFTGGVPIAGLCIWAGSYTEGSRCQGGGCGLGLQCFAPSTTIDTYHCGRSCDPEAEAGQVGSCEAPDVCETDTGTTARGACVEHCEPLDADAPECPSDEWCVPVFDYEEGYSVLRGHCLKTGNHPKGAPCQQGECEEGLACVRAPGPFVQAEAYCQVLCDPSESAACEAGERCIPYRQDGASSAIGTCQASCALWESDPCAAGCGSDEWCAPTYFDEGFGHCTRSVGEQPTGADCDALDTCSAGHQCLCGAGDFLCQHTDSRCVKVCSRSAAVSEPGSCQVDEVCAAEMNSGQPLAYGSCRPSCDYDAGVACADSTETCVPGELLPHGEDTCYAVPERASCGALAQPGEPCGATDLCLGETVLTDCVDACRSSAGDFGTSNHPDCADPTAVCAERSPGLPYGECR